MKEKLLAQSIVKFLSGLALTAVLLFVPAGSLNYWNAWLLMGVLFLPILILAVVLLIKNPELLQKRLKMKETQPEQIYVIVFSSLMFVCGFLLAGLDYRFQWSMLSPGISFLASFILLISYLIFAEVLRENTYLSRVVEVQDGQTVINSGLYGLVRHPMYTATILLFLSIPLVLGSLLSLIIFMPYPFIIARRIAAEERLLEEELTGYTEYKQKVKYRLIPYIW